LVFTITKITWSALGWKIVQSEKKMMKKLVQRREMVFTYSRLVSKTKSLSTSAMAAPGLQ